MKIWRASIQWTGGHAELGEIEAESYEQAIGAAKKRISAAAVMVRQPSAKAPNPERRSQLLDPTDLSGGGFGRFHKKKESKDDGLDQ